MIIRFNRHNAAELLAELHDWFGSDPDDPTYKAAILLLLGVERRKHLGDLTTCSGYPRDFVQGVLRNLRQAGTWRRESTDSYVSWVKHPETLVLDAMVGAGILERSPRP